MSPFKIYSSPDWRIEGRKIILMLAPFLGFEEVSEEDPDYGRFADYLNNGREIFEIKEHLNECDVAVYPHEFNGTAENLRQIREIAEILKVSNKKLLLFYNSDDDSEIAIENTLIFRTSFYKSRKKKNEYALPGWSVDFKRYFKNNIIEFIEPQTKPSVSYCGYIDNTPLGWKQRIKSLFEKKIETQEEKAKYRRGEACRRLAANPEIKTDFIIRTGFWAHGLTDKKAARAEYANNMISSLYGIVTRGGGNFSYRMYEMLSCGRIPVFINTDCVLPFDDIINWKNHVVWLDESELKNIDQVLLTFHRSKTQEELIQMQRRNRKLYEDFISPIGFHKQLSVFLTSQLS